MKRLFCLFMASLIGLTFVPAAVYAQAAPGSIVFSQQDLDQMLAPIALYPDPLLSQILMASTYPLEAVEAARFVRRNPALKGDALARAVEGQSWDPSVKALAQFPAVLTMMDDQLSWTEQLGDAFLAQQDAVMDTVQSLRARAQAAGTLRNSQQQRIVMQDGLIDIEPYASDVIYVPYYNPTVVYGNWWWPQRPPMIWTPPPVYRPRSYDNAIVAGIAFGVGIGIMHAIFSNARPDWHAHHVIVNGGPIYNRPGQPNRSPGGMVWAHNPQHRLGFAYRDAATRNRFQQSAGGAADRARASGQVGAPPSIAAPVAQSRPVIPRGGEQNRPGDAHPPAPTALQPHPPGMSQVSPQQPGVVHPERRPDSGQPVNEHRGARPGEARVDAMKPVAPAVPLPHPAAAAQAQSNPASQPHPAMRAPAEQPRADVRGGHEGAAPGAAPRPPVPAHREPEKQSDGPKPPGNAERERDPQHERQRDREH